MSKMYICVREDFPDYMTPTLVAHAVLRHHLNHESLPDIYLRYYLDWLDNSFKKCVVRMNAKEFAKVRELEGIVESWENNTLNGEVSCVTIIPLSTIPNVLKFAKLWKPKELE